MGLQTQSPLTDLASRLERAVTYLQAEQKRYQFGAYEWLRLEGKIEGVKLALSYVREYE